MNWLLDTCVQCEYAKRQPHAGVLGWLDAQPEAGLFISALSRGLGLVTRNTADFARHPQVFNPWAA